MVQEIITYLSTEVGQIAVEVVQAGFFARRSRLREYDAEHCIKRPEVRERHCYGDDPIVFDEQLDDALEADDSTCDRIANVSEIISHCQCDHRTFITGCNVIRTLLCSQGEHQCLAIVNIVHLSQAIEKQIISRSLLEGGH